MTDALSVYFSVCVDVRGEDSGHIGCRHLPADISMFIPLYVHGILNVSLTYKPSKSLSRFYLGSDYHYHDTISTLTRCVKKQRARKIRRPSGNIFYGAQWRHFNKFLGVLSLPFPFAPPLFPSFSLPSFPFFLLPSLFPLFFPFLPSSPLRSRSP